MSALTADGLAGASPTFDPARTEGGGSPDTVRNLRTALLLGWRVESNWTDPVLFFIYTVARPIASLLLLVAMVTIIGGSANDDVRTFVVLGSALWAMLVAGLAGPAWSVRENENWFVSADGKSLSTPSAWMNVRRFSFGPAASIAAAVRLIASHHRIVGPCASM